MAQKKLNISKAIKRPGGLHKSLGIPQDEKIPLDKAEAAADKKGLVGQQARFYLNVLRKASRKRKKKSLLR
jgi:hypothetical protein